MKRQIKITVMLVLLYCFNMSSFFGEDIDQQLYNDVIKKLTNDSTRTWTFQRFETYMGAENGCKQGESYIFNSNGTLKVKICKDNKLETKNFNWSIDLKDSYDIILKYDNSIHYLIFPKQKIDPAIELMIIRTKATEKTKRTEDRMFIYEDNSVD